MDTKTLAAQLTALEQESDQHKQQTAFEALKMELQRDALEVVVDEDRQFAVRLKQQGVLQ